jgi:hypothetical protein
VDVKSIFLYFVISTQVEISFVVCFEIPGQAGNDIKLKYLKHPLGGG